MSIQEFYAIAMVLAGSFFTISIVITCDTWKKIKFKEFEMIERLEKPFSDKEMPFHSGR